MIEPLSTETISVEAPLPVRAMRIARDLTPKRKHASTTLCAVGRARRSRPFRSISYQSAENRKRSNDNTMPSADVSATSGFRFGLPPVMLV